MKFIIFDSSTIISLAMNGLLDKLEKLKKEFDGKFLITKEVYYEVVELPVTIKRFEFEAVMVKRLVENKTLEFPESISVKSRDVSNKTKEILDVANRIFFSNKKEINLIASGEASCLALSKILNDKRIENVVAVYERTTRLLGEKPENLKKIMEGKLHTKLDARKKNYDYFKGMKFIRSSELMYVAYKKGIFEINDKLLLDALLYALKFKGCSISDEEISEIKGLK